MKKTIIILVSFISIIILSSCGNSVKEQRLIEMRDSIQSQIDWQNEKIAEEYAYLDSLWNTDRDKYGFSHEFSMKVIEGLQKNIDRETEELFQINLELNK